MGIYGILWVFIKESIHTIYNLIRRKAYKKVVKTRTFNYEEHCQINCKPGSVI